MHVFLLFPKQRLWCTWGHNLFFIATPTENLTFQKKRIILVQKFLLMGWKNSSRELPGFLRLNDHRLPLVAHHVS